MNKIQFLKLIEELLMSEAADCYCDELGLPWVCSVELTPTGLSVQTEDEIFTISVKKCNL
jgi:hypothetical protein